MSADAPTTGKSGKALQAEFDLLADEYRDQHKDNVAITGEAPEYFSEYKIADLQKFLHQSGRPAGNIVDFGSGIGNSLPYFRKHFPGSTLTCADVSARSIEIAQSRFPGGEKYVLVDDRVDLPSDSQDLVFSACVFHHIPLEQHHHWLVELLRITRPGGVLAIYEHNPFNPLTVRAVNTCPLDVNAHLIRGSHMRQHAHEAGWQDAQVAYKLFFPAMLSGLRLLEPRLEWLALGAQYRMTARKRP